MSATFIMSLITAFVMLVYWRATLMIVAALIIALIVTGISAFSGAIASPEPPAAIVAPAQPGARPPDAAVDPDEPTDGTEADPRAQEPPH